MGSWSGMGYLWLYSRLSGNKRCPLPRFCTKGNGCISENLPEDYVPYWDFNDPSIPDAPRMLLLLVW